MALVCIDIPLRHGARECDLALQGAVPLKSCTGVPRMVDCGSAKTIEDSVSLSLTDKNFPSFDVQFMPFLGCEG